MLRLWQQVRDAGAGLEPDPDFLADPKLGRYIKNRLEPLALPPNVEEFLVQVGLPDRFLDHRSPDEARDDEKSCCPGVVFWLSCLRLEKIKGKGYLVIGEYRALDRACSTVNFGKPDRKDVWMKTEDFAPVVVELKTGSVWRWMHDSFGDELTFINSSLEQYLLSMALWRAFYPELARQVAEYLAQHPEKTELDYIFPNRRALYAPFRAALQALDPDALKKRRTYWRFMCDLSLY